MDKTLMKIFDSLSDLGRQDVIDFARELLNSKKEQERIDAQNQAFWEKLEESHRQFLNGQVVVKTMEELEAMAR